MLEEDGVFKIAASYPKVRDFLTSEAWEFQGRDPGTEMNWFKQRKAAKELFVEDISDDFAVTFLMGDMSLEEFGQMASRLTPEIELLEVDSSWEGKPTTIVVAMTEDQVKRMFGRRAKMRKLVSSRPTSLV